RPDHPTEEPSDPVRRLVGGAPPAGGGGGPGHGDHCAKGGREPRHPACGPETVRAGHLRKRLRDDAAAPAPPAPASRGLSMTRRTMVEAIRDAMDVAMARDDNV